MENLKFIKGLINSNEKTISVWVSTLEGQKCINIKVDTTENDTFFENLIDMANRHYAATIFNIKESEKIQEYGCLTSKVLGLSDIPLTFMNPKYLINLFIKLVECLLLVDETTRHYFIRDECSVELPTTEQNISNLISDVMTTCLNDNSSIDGNDIDIKDLFLTVLYFMSNLSASNVKKINNNSLKKKINMAGGIRNIQQLYNNDFLKNKIDTTLRKTGDTIHHLIREHKSLILQQHKSCFGDFHVILDVIKSNPNLTIYQNTNISYKFMMQFIRNLFNELFIEILPKTTMTNCLYATLYQASVLNELNILKYNSKYIQIPIIYKLIYSFYKCDYQLPSQSSDINRSIWTLIDQLSEKDIQQTHIVDILCQIALKVDIHETNQLDEIFWLLNEKRGYTYEFYIILLISLYSLCRCQTMNKPNKLLNCKKFIMPLYDIIYNFYSYVVLEIKDLNMALCDQTLNNFSKMYSREIMHCFKKFSTTMMS